VKEQIISVTREVEANLGEEFREKYEINSADITYEDKLSTNYKKKLIDLKKSKFKINTQVVTKSYKFHSLYLLDYRNEILAHKVLSKCDKKEYFSEFIGFILGKYEDHPYYGTIVIKLYNLGDLSSFTINNEENYELNPEKNQQLTDIAHQIARGLFSQKLGFFRCFFLNNLFFYKFKQCIT
jgi:hypothetical protein